MTTLETNVTIAPDGRLTGQAPPETPQDSTGPSWSLWLHVPAGLNRRLN